MVSVCHYCIFFDFYHSIWNSAWLLCEPCTSRLVENRFKVLSRACTKVASSYYQSKEKTGKKRDGIEQTQHIHIYPPHVIRGITFHFSIHLKTMAENRRSNHLKKKISSKWATVKKCQLATEYFFSCHIRDLKFKLGRKEGRQWLA